MDFWISEWISGFQNGFLDFKLDFWISQWISGFLDFSLDFWISQWISGFQFGFLLTVYEISFLTDPSAIDNISADFTRVFGSLIITPRIIPWGAATRS